MNSQEILIKYSINKEYTIVDFGKTTPELVELQDIDGIIAYIEYLNRPLLHPFRYSKVTIFRLQPIV